MKITEALNLCGELVEALKTVRPINHVLVVHEKNIECVHRRACRPGYISLFSIHYVHAAHGLSAVDWSVLEDRLRVLIAKGEL